MTVAKVEIVGLAQFRADLKNVGREGPRALSKAIRAGGEPIVSTASSKAPRRTGLLAGSYSIKTRATTGAVVNQAPYGAGAEWGRKGKWEGFFRYGQPPRFAGAALTERADDVQDIISRGLDDIITIFGWAK
jgi:hypothetical protein